MRDKDNYFERTRQRLHAKKYRFYFFDYLYYKGERWSEKTYRCSGSFMIWWFWWLDVLIPAIVLLPSGLTDSEHYSVGAALFCFPFVFTLIRYRKGRKAAIMSHYRRNSKNSGFTMFLLVVLSFVLCGIEMWVLGKMELVVFGAK